MATARSWVRAHDNVRLTTPRALEALRRQTPTCNIADADILLSLLYSHCYRDYSASHSILSSVPLPERYKMVLQLPSTTIRSTSPWLSSSTTGCLPCALSCFSSLPMPLFLLST